MANQIGDRIKSLRLNNGYTQSDLGKMIYVSGQSVSKWEKGESSPSIDNIDLLCKVFKISPNELLDYKAEKTVTSTEYGADKIIQTCTFGFFINLFLYVLGTVIIYVFEAVIYWSPYNLIIGGVLWALAGIFTIYNLLNNIVIFRRINGSFKHIVFILTYGFTSILMFPYISINMYQMISEMINPISFGEFEFALWFSQYGTGLITVLASVLLYSILLIICKKKYSRNS